MNNRSVPTTTLIPHIVYRSLPDACAWLTRVFGFTEHFRYGDPVSGMQLHLGDAYIMITGPRPSPQTQSPAILGACTQFLTIIVPNVDAHYLHTQQEQAIIWEELNETVYGERQYGAEDLDGHRWIFSQHARDLSPTDWGATPSLHPTHSPITLSS
jgi:uncharacterized glyoxalase superfamily protein PhnB